MESGHGRLTIGFPRMRKEPGERRDFLPPLLGKLIHHGAEIVVERGIGSGMGYRDPDYTGLDRHVLLGTDGGTRPPLTPIMVYCPLPAGCPSFSSEKSVYSPDDLYTGATASRTMAQTFFFRPPYGMSGVSRVMLSIRGKPPSPYDSASISPTIFDQMGPSVGSMLNFTTHGAVLSNTHPK